MNPNSDGAAGWAYGDFNGYGVVNNDDYLIWLAGYQSQGSPLWQETVGAGPVNGGPWTLAIGGAGQRVVGFRSSRAGLDRSSGRGPRLFWFWFRLSKGKGFNNAWKEVSRGTGRRVGDRGRWRGQGRGASGHAAREFVGVYNH